MDDIVSRLEKLSPKQLSGLVLKMQSKLDEYEKERKERKEAHDQIAIIGIGCRFPGGANDPASFWQLLHDGTDAISEVPRARWNIEDYYDPNPDVPGKMYTRWGGFLQQPIDQFDAAFFGISPREANSMDPQQRLLLEVAWEAVENAGISLKGLAGSKTSVFIGSNSSDYATLSAEVPDESIDVYTGTAIAPSVMAGRISYFLDLHGPSVTLDTACSSSLVATHLACQTLFSHECDMALAGGVNLMLSPLSTLGACKMGILAPDGRCKTFDAMADGFVRGEGCGILVLKRLTDAQRDGDPILAIIAGSAVNQDGHSAGLTAPNQRAQERVMRQAFAQARIEPAQLSYIETHGTGTSLGDPIEIEALKAVIARDARPDQTCFIGSVKTNIGHLEAAAGVASIIKVILSLQQEKIPAHLHLKSLNPNISLDHTPFEIPTQLLQWEKTKTPRYSSVSSFGWSGTNAFLILQEPPQTKATRSPDAQASANDPPVYMLPLSTRNPASLQPLAEAYLHLLQKSHAQESLYDLCYTSSVRHTHHEYRLAAIGSTVSELSEQLQTYLQRGISMNLATGTGIVGEHPKLVFVFPGQGSQWIGMARTLMQQEPVFAQMLTDCEQVMKPYVDWSLHDLLLQAPMQEHVQLQLQDIAVLQPVLFAIEVALSALWRSWGIVPDAVIGHSMGEIAAATVAGILSLAQAAQIICERSRLLKQVSGQGAMVLVELSVAELEPILAQRTDISVAISNSLRSTVIAGNRQSLEPLVHDWQQQGLFCRWIKVDVASHSPQMEPLLPELSRRLQSLHPQEGSIPLFSTVQGTWQEGQECTAAYWSQNLRQPVRFAQSITQLVEEGFHTFLEISPHPILLAAIEENLQEQEGAFSLLASLRRDEPERASLLRSLAQLYTQGYPINWSALYPQGGQCVPLPTYPWQRQRFWLESVKTGMPEHQTVRSSPSYDSEVIDIATTTGTTRVRMINPNDAGLAFLNDQRIQDIPVLPATFYVELARSAANELLSGQIAVKSTNFYKALLLTPGQPVQIQLVTTAVESGNVTIQLFSRIGVKGKMTAASDWQLHASSVAEQAGFEPFSPINLSAVQEHCQGYSSGEDYYKLIQEQDIYYGPAYRGIQELWYTDTEVLARIRLPVAAGEKGESYPIHPVLLDMGMQSLGALLLDTLEKQKNVTYFPVSLDLFRVHRRYEQNILWTYVRRIGEKEDGKITVDIFLLDERGKLIAEARMWSLQALIVSSENTQSGTHQLQPAKRILEQLEKVAVEKRQEALERHLIEQIAYILRLNPSTLDRLQPLGAAGFDSLMAVQLRNRLEGSLGIKLPATLIWSYPHIAAMTTYLLTRLNLLITTDQGNEVQATVEDLHEEQSDEEHSQKLKTELADLSAEELAVLLAQEMAEIQGETA